MADSPTNSKVLVVRPADTNAPAQTKQDLRDIKPPVYIPNGWEWLFWVLGAAVVAAAITLLVKNWGRWRKPPPLPAPIPPHIRARQRLQEALRLIDQPKPFCILVSDALRGYLEDRFQLRAPERTTEEFLREVQGSQLLTAAQQLRLEEFLTRCDMVKFAKYEPARAELQELLQTAGQFIEETIPVPAPETAPARLS